MVFGHFSHIATNIARTETAPATIPTIVPVSRWLLLDGELFPPPLLVPDPAPVSDGVIVDIGDASTAVGAASIDRRGEHCTYHISIDLEVRIMQVKDVEAHTSCHE